MLAQGYRFRPILDFDEFQLQKKNPQRKLKNKGKKAWKGRTKQEGSAETQTEKKKQTHTYFL